MRHKRRSIKVREEENEERSVYESGSIESTVVNAIGEILR